MAVRAYGQLLIQTTTPGEDPVMVGTVWSDTSAGTLKICTSVAPYTFSAIGTSDPLVLTTSITVPTIYGSAVANGDLTIKATSHATVATANIFINEGQGQVVIGGGAVNGTAPLYVTGTGEDIGYLMKLKPSGVASAYLIIQGTGASGNAGINLTNDSEFFIQFHKVNGAFHVQGPGSATMWYSGNGNLILGTTFNDPGTGTNCMIFPDATAPASLDSNTAGIYADDVGGTVEMFGINETGVTTQLTGLGVRKTADESVTSSTIQADDHLTVQLAASSTYYFRILLHVTTASANAGIKVQLDGTAGLGNLCADVILFDHGGNTHIDIAQMTAFNSSVGANGTGTLGVTIEGSIETTTAGTLFLEWAQNTTDAGNATTVQEGSTFILQKLNA